MDDRPSQPRRPSRRPKDSRRRCRNRRFPGVIPMSSEQRNHPGAPCLSHQRSWFAQRSDAMNVRFTEGKFVDEMSAVGRYRKFNQSRSGRWRATGHMASGDDRCT